MCDAAENNQDRVCVIFQRFPKSKLAIPFLVASLVVFYPYACLSQSPVSREIESVSQSPKLIRSESIVQDFIDGGSTTRVIVNLKRPAVEDSLQSLKNMEARHQLEQSISRAQDQVINRLDKQDVRVTNRFKYIFGFSAEVTLRGLQELIDNPSVLSIEKDEILHAHLAQGIPLMNATTARSSYNGSGLAIAICDTGIDYNHPKLGGGGFPNSKVIGGYDCGDNDNDPMDQNGHGTACAGIAAGDLGTEGDYIGGVAYGARLYAVKIAYGSGGSAWTSDMIEGWEWCITHQNDNASNPIMVISTSFGGGRYDSSCDSYETAMTTAAANAVAVGITIFCSSGNDGYCDSIGWPACISYVISVGAVYDAAFGTYSSCVSSSSCATKYFTWGCSTHYYAIDSTSGDMVTSYSNTYSLLNLLAPSNQAYTTDISGSSGYSSGDYYSGFGGTSAACPYAAGAAACLQSAYKALTGSFLTPSQVKSKLVDNGDSITDNKVNITKPRVNLGAAVAALSSCPSCSGTVVVLQNMTFASGTACECVATTSITAGSGVTIKSGANVTFRAPTVRLQPGFHVESGATFNVRQ
jgi:subtilisin family serine protease